MPDAYSVRPAAIASCPFSAVPPNAAPKGFSRSFSAGTFAPPVIGVQYECVLSSKKRMRVIVSTWYQSAKTTSPRPWEATSSAIFEISAALYSSSESTRSSAP